MVTLSVLDSVSEALEHAPGEEWQRMLALSLASAMDATPSASTARELRVLMGELGVTGAIPGTGDVSDDLAAKRAARRAAAGP